jgi:hypothetical protein
MSPPVNKRQRVADRVVTRIPQNPSIIEQPSTSVSLASLLAPLSPDTFLRESFQKCAVYVSGRHDRFARLCQEHLYDLDTASLLRETSSDRIFVWLSRSGTTDDSSPPYINSIEVSDADTALALYKSGHSTYCRAPPLVEQHLVSTLLADTGFGCGQYDASCTSVSCMGRGEVEVFQSCTSDATTGWHFDFQENFTLQLSGVKRWTLQRGTVQHPLRACTPHYESPESVEPQLKSAIMSNTEFEFGAPQAGVNAQGDKETVVMTPGDVLYFPAGMWHKVEVVEPGVSINVSLMASSYAEVTCQALKHLLLKRDEWRQSVIHNSATNVVDKLKGLLKELPSLIDEFERMGGAESIIPPVARSGNAIKLESEDDSVDEDDEERDGVVDVMRFHDKCSTTESQLRERLKTYGLIKNPLASLLSEDEICRYYKTGDVDYDSGETEADDLCKKRQVYVLNVNYAGNEMHESAVRVRIRENGMLLKHIHGRFKQKCNDLMLRSHGDWIALEKERLMLGYLIYQGCLLWTPLVAH